MNEQGISHHRHPCKPPLIGIDNACLDPGSPTLINSVEANLTSALPRLNPFTCKDVDDRLREIMPPCKDWTEINIFDKLIFLVAKVSGRVFVGLEVSQTPEYIDTAVNYTLQFMHAVHVVKTIRPWLKPSLGPRTPEIQKLLGLAKLAEKLLGPIIEEKIHRRANDSG
ncbi:hypothetical protein COCMIDRAFT_21423 [Bipolaris oryzae ATCC 44560]|uniref:Uncharacterized protein n=1 Tax=Bipolaris oryzae ATCC 44560 TaxID=930090 RepID=W7A4G4_COCMI|nr:uncharacterized protein COCMIDRAFT_21423 [Bipolaris oryzae ATCC 44560]EUC51026.1 hypothetical protein COCMIDRAFT_21423 [Bipolaris oryzae ATCC 44560]